MNLKDLIFGGGVKSGDDGGTYRDSIQAWLPIKNIIGGVVITKDGRFVKILELLPVNIYLKSPNDRQNIISSFAAYLKIAPNDLQMVARTLPADTQAYVEQMQRYAEKEDNEACREMIEDNIQEIGNGIASDAMRHRFFLVFQYEAGMRAKRNTVDSIIQRLNEEADTARRYGEAYHCLHAPIHLLSCDETGAQQLQIMTVPDYRVKLTRLMLRSAYQPPPEDIAAWDGLYNGHPFVIGADMDLRRIDTAVRTAKQHGCLPIALAALESQGSAVLLQRYADPGCATVYKVTENALSELLGRAPNLYVPPRTQFLTEKGDVVDAPLIKAPGKAGGPHRK